MCKVKIQLGLSHNKVEVGEPVSGRPHLECIFQEARENRLHSDSVRPTVSKECEEEGGAI
jgi:hypothetical protein